MPIKRAYYVHEDGAERGIAIVATSTREAKRIAFATPGLECDWIDMRCQWQRKAKIDDLPVGVIDDPMLALQRGVYDCIEPGVCEICGRDEMCVECIGGKVVCDCCKERIYNTSNEYLNTIPVKTKT